MGRAADAGCIARRRVRPKTADPAAAAVLLRMLKAQSSGTVVGH